MRLIAASFCVLVSMAPASQAADEPNTTTRPVVRRGDTVVIADSNSLSFRQSRKEDAKLLSDVDREESETIFRMNATRGTWQSYLLYTTPEMKVPASRPGFTITLGPPSRQELERRRQKRAAGEKAALAGGPEPAPEAGQTR